METEAHYPKFSMALRGMLLLSGVYTAIWGGLIRWFGSPVFQWLSMQENFQLANETWTYGTIGLVTGFCLVLSAFYPLSLIYLLGVGLLGKITNVIWYLTAYAGDLGWNKRSIFHFVFNEAIWLIVVAFILYQAVRVRQYLLHLKE